MVAMTQPLDKSGLNYRRGAARCLGAVLVLSLLAPALVCAGGVLLYRGQFVYVLPETLTEKLEQISGRETWRHFPAHTRRIDPDGDGVDDFVAIALGAKGGYGVQVRYRLRQPEDGGNTRLGAWYWCVVTDDSGRKLFERFNP